MNRQALNKKCRERVAWLNKYTPRSHQVDPSVLKFHVDAVTACASYIDYEQPREDKSTTAHVSPNDKIPTEALLLAPRRSGKTSESARLAALLLYDGLKLNLLLCAPSPAASTGFFRLVALFFKQLPGGAERVISETDTEFCVVHARLSWRSTLRVAGEDTTQVDVLFVDEAAAVPVTRLIEILSAARRSGASVIINSTEINGSLVQLLRFGESPVGPLFVTRIFQGWDQVAPTEEKAPCATPFYSQPGAAVEERPPASAGSCVTFFHQTDSNTSVMSTVVRGERGDATVVGLFRVTPDGFGPGLAQYFREIERNARTTGLPHFICAENTYGGHILAAFIVDQCMQASPNLVEYRTSPEVAGVHTNRQAAREVMLTDVERGRFAVDAGVVVHVPVSREKRDLSLEKEIVADLLILLRGVTEDVSKCSKAFNECISMAAHVSTCVGK